MWASELVGRNPRGALGAVSLSVRQAVVKLSQRGMKHLVVACSGGADSLALALCVADVCSRMGIGFSSVTVDHGVRAGSAVEARDVQLLLHRLGFMIAEGVTLPAQVVASPGALGPEGAARTARFEAIDGCVRQWGTPGVDVFVALGHTMDDQAESVVLGVGRGSGAASIKGMVDGIDAPGQGGYVRPLLGVRRWQTVEACHAVGLTPVDDPSNYPFGPWRAADGSPLRRAAIRHEAIPAISRALRMDVVPALAATAHMLHDDNEALEQLAFNVLKQAIRDAKNHPAPSGTPEEPQPHSQPHTTALAGQDTALCLHTTPLEQTHRAIASRAIKAALHSIGCPPGDLKRSHINAVLDLVTNWHGQGPVDLPGKKQAKRQPGTKLLILYGTTH